MWKRPFLFPPTAWSWAFECLLLLVHKDSVFKLTIDISVRKMILKMEYFINSMIYQMLKFFKGIISFHPKMILRHFSFKKNTGLLIFNSLKQKKLIFNFFVNRNWKKLTDSRKRAKIFANNRNSYDPIETLFKELHNAIDRQYTERGQQ